jgi:hypothetical protein
MLDVAGHYARPDVFQLSVLREAKAVIGERTAAPRQGDKTKRATRANPKKK